MNAPEHSKVLREIDHVTEHCSNPSVGGGSPVPCSNEQSPPWNPLGPWAPGEGTFETFVGGAGI
jgi:hypothetical protein